MVPGPGETGKDKGPACLPGSRPTLRDNRPVNGQCCSREEHSTTGTQQKGLTGPEGEGSHQDAHE